MRVLCMLCGSISIDIYYNLSAVWARLMFDAFGCSHSCHWGDGGALSVLPLFVNIVYFNIYSAPTVFEIRVWNNKNVRLEYVCVKW